MLPSAPVDGTTAISVVPLLVTAGGAPKVEPLTVQDSTVAADGGFGGTMMFNVPQGDVEQVPLTPGYTA